MASTSSNASTQQDTLESILRQNLENNELMIEAVNGEITVEEFKQKANARFSQWQWASSKCSYNIRNTGFACKHQCTYCYILPMDRRFNRDPTIVDMEDEFPLDKSQVNKAWRKTDKRGVYFFPSSHDIFVENMVDYVTVCEKMVMARHSIMFVTKPSLASITEYIRLVKESKYCQQLMANTATWITITSDDDDVLKVFEPNAASYQERVECLKLLYKNGFRTAIMCEPYLTDPRFVFKLTQWVRYAIAIGPLNYSSAYMFPDEGTPDSAISGDEGNPDSAISGDEENQETIAEPTTQEIDASDEKSTSRQQIETISTPKFLFTLFNEIRRLKPKVPILIKTHGMEIILRGLKKAEKRQK